MPLHYGILSRYVSDTPQGTRPRDKANAARMGRGKLRYALDIHCPYISKRNPKDINDRLFFTAPQSEKANRNLEKFMASLSNELAKSPDRPQLNPDDIVKYGTMRNRLKDLVNFKFWAKRLPSVGFVASLEIPYTNISGKWKATPENAKHIGEKIVDQPPTFSNRPQRARTDSNAAPTRASTARSARVSKRAGCF